MSGISYINNLRNSYHEEAGSGNLNHFIDSGSSYEQEGLYEAGSGEHLGEANHASEFCGQYPLGDADMANELGTDDRMYPSREESSSQYYYYYSDESSPTSSEYSETSSSSTLIPDPEIRFLQTSTAVDEMKELPYRLMRNKAESVAAQKQIHEDAASNAYFLKDIYAKIDVKIYTNDHQSFITSSCNLEWEPVNLRMSRVVNGCKRFWSLDGTRGTLVVPENYSFRVWPEIVEREEKYAKMLKANGMLSHPLTVVDVSSRKDSSVAIPGYFLKSIEQLKEDGIYVLRDSSGAPGTWIKERRFLFADESERNCAGNWDPILKGLISDITNLFFLQVPIYKDSVNVAFVRTNSVSLPYEARYFGANFAKVSKPTNKGHCHNEIPRQAEKVKAFVGIAIHQILEAEFRGSNQDYSDLEKILVSRCSKTVFQNLMNNIY